MTIAFVIACLVAIAVVAVLVLRAPGQARSSVLDELEAHAVVLHTKDGQSLRGLLTLVRPDAFVLDNVEALNTSGAQPVKGPVLVPRANTAWFQRLGGEA